MYHVCLPFTFVNELLMTCIHRSRINDVKTIALYGPKIIMRTQRTICNLLLLLLLLLLSAVDDLVSFSVSPNLTKYQLFRKLSLIFCYSFNCVGDVVLGGRKLSEEEGPFIDNRKPSGFDTKQIFVSPSVRYSGHNCCAKSKRCYRFF